MDYQLFGQVEQYNNMKKVIKLTESDLIKIIKRVMVEQPDEKFDTPYNKKMIKDFNKPTPLIPIPSLSCVPLAFQGALSELINQGNNKLLLKTSLGIIGRESDFGESNRYKLLSGLKALLAMVGVKASVGMGQIKPATAKKYGVTISELLTAMGTLKTIYNVLSDNYQLALKVGYTSEPSSNFTKGTGNSALDIAIAAYNAGAAKIIKYCKTNNPKINKPCSLAGKTIEEQSVAGAPLNGALYNSATPKTSITVTNQYVPNYLPNFKTKRIDGVSITSHGYVKEVAESIKKYTCF